MKNTTCIQCRHFIPNDRNPVMPGLCLSLQAELENAGISADLCEQAVKRHGGKTCRPHLIRDCEAFKDTRGWLFRLVFRLVMAVKS